jgi:hypothetical protein
MSRYGNLSKVQTKRSCGATYPSLYRHTHLDWRTAFSALRIPCSQIDCRCFQKPPPPIYDFSSVETNAQSVDGGSHNMPWELDHTILIVTRGFLWLKLVWDWNVRNKRYWVWCHSHHAKQVFGARYPLSGVQPKKSKIWWGRGHEGFNMSFEQSIDVHIVEHVCCKMSLI